MLEPKPKDSGEGDGAKGPAEEEAKKVDKDGSGKTEDWKGDEK